MARKFKKRNTNKKRKNNFDYELKPDKIYFEGIITDFLPGTRFKVKVERAEGLEPLYLDTGLRTFFKARKIMLIRGDKVTVEVDPAEDLTKGTIVMMNRTFTGPPRNKK